MHGLEDVGRDRAIKKFLRGRGMIAQIATGAGFILHLHHQDGALRVRRLEVGHQRGECLLSASSEAVAKGEGESTALPFSSIT